MQCLAFIWCILHVKYVFFSFFSLLNWPVSSVPPHSWPAYGVLCIWSVVCMCASCTNRKEEWGPGTPQLITYLESCVLDSYRFYNPVPQEKQSYVHIISTFAYVKFSLRMLFCVYGVMIFIWCDRLELTLCKGDVRFRLSWCLSLQLLCHSSFQLIWLVIHRTLIQHSLLASQVNCIDMAPNHSNDFFM